MDKPNFVYVTYIKASAEKVWKALTSSEFTQQYWFGIRFETDWRAGSNFVAQNSDASMGISGKVLEFDPPRRLSYTFLSKHAQATQEEPSRVVLTLDPMGEQVKLTVIHDNFAAGSKALESVSQGWPMVLSGLKSLLETGNALHIPHPGCVKAEATASV